jgi:CheY-like chemotaxis protein
MLKSFLTFEGHTVRSALDGRTGVAMAKENGYDNVICDIGSPGVSGFEVEREIPRKEPPESTAPFRIALTGYGQAENRTRAAGAEFEHYLVKPVDGNALLSLIFSRVRAI